MSTKEVSKNEETKSTSVADLDMKLEVVVIPVSDVDRAKKFYSRLGRRLDADRAAGDNFRLVQFTPPGSGSRPRRSNIIAVHWRWILPFVRPG